MQTKVELDKHDIKHNPRENAASKQGIKSSSDIVP